MSVPLLTRLHSVTWWSKVGVAHVLVWGFTGMRGPTHADCGAHKCGVTRAGCTFQGVAMVLVGAHLLWETLVLGVMNGLTHWGSPSLAVLFAPP